MNNLTDENAIKVITEIMNLQGGFDLLRLTINKKNSCWWRLSDSDAMNSTGAASADYLGQINDVDGVEILAVLMVDKSNYPVDFEIIKLDGGKIILNMNEVKFNYVKSGGERSVS